MGNITVIEIFKDHKLIKDDEKQCDYCYGTLYRIFKNGTIICVKCKRTISHPNEKKEKEKTPND